MKAAFAKLHQKDRCQADCSINDIKYRQLDRLLIHNQDVCNAADDDP